MTQLERLLEEVDALSLEDKERLYEHLTQQLDEKANPLLSEEWQAEIARRLDDYDRGATVPENVDDVVGRLRKQLGSQ